MNKDYLTKSNLTTGRWCISQNELNCGRPISVKIKNRSVSRNIEHNGKYYYFLSHTGLKIDLSQNLYCRDDYKRYKNKGITNEGNTPIYREHSIVLYLVIFKEKIMKIEVRVINLKNYKYVNGFINSINDITSLESEVNPTGANDTDEVK